MRLEKTLMMVRTLPWHPFLAFARDAGILTAQRVVQRAAGLVGLYFLVRHFTNADFGHYQIVGVVVALMAFTALPGLDNALMQSVSRGSRDFYYKAVRSSAFASCLGAVLVAAAAGVLVWFQPGAVAPLLAAALFFPAYAGLAQWKSVLLAERRFLKLAAAEAVTSLTTQSALICAVLIDVRQVWIFACLFVAPTALTNLCATLVFLRRTEPTQMTDDTRALYRYGLQTSVVTMLSMIAEQIERLTIFLLINPATLAIYLAGDRLSELIRSLFQDAAAVLAPRFARMTSYDVQTARAIWIICAIAGLAIVLFAFTLAEPLLLAIFGSNYAPSVPYAKAMLCSVAIGNVGNFQFRFIRSQRDSRSFRSIILWTSALRIASALVLIGFLGVWGAVASVFIHRLVTSVLSSLMVQRHYQATAE